MTTRTQIIQELEDAKHGHYKDCYALETGDDTECNCPSKDKNAAIDAAIAELEKPEAVQAEPVAYPDERHIREWFQLSTCAHHIDEDGEYIGKRAMFLACKAIDWYRSQHPSPKPADERIIPATCGGREHCSRFPFCPCSAPDPLPERDPAKPAEKQGLFNKFSVRRTDGSDQIGGKHQGCEYFVLDVKCDRFAKAALTAYADACKHDYLELSVNMRDRYDLSPPKEAEASLRGMVPVEALKLAANALIQASNELFSMDENGTDELRASEAIEQFLAALPPAPGEGGKV